MENAEKQMRFILKEKKKNSCLETTSAEPDTPNHHPHPLQYDTHRHTYRATHTMGDKIRCFKKS